MSEFSADAKVADQLSAEITVDHCLRPAVQLLYCRSSCHDDILTCRMHEAEQIHTTTLVCVYCQPREPCRILFTKMFRHL